MECKKCGTSKNETHFYKYFNELYCFDCLLEEMGIETYTEIHYSLDNEYLGDDDDIIDVLKDYGVTEIESEG